MAIKPVLDLPDALHDAPKVIVAAQNNERSVRSVVDLQLVIATIQQLRVERLFGRCGVVDLVFEILECHGAAIGFMGECEEIVE